MSPVTKSKCRLQIHVVTNCPSIRHKFTYDARDININNKSNAFYGIFCYEIYKLKMVSFNHEINYSFKCLMSYESIDVCILENIKSALFKSISID